MSKQTIELDCAPGMTRPGDLIQEVIKDSGLPEKEDCGRSFGNWTWDYSDIPKGVWEKAQKLIKSRIEALYHAGAIRYGSW